MDRLLLGVEGLTKAEERRVDDGFAGQVLWSRTSVCGLLCGYIGIDKACLLFSEHRWFARCKVDKGCVKEA